MTPGFWRLSHHTSSPIMQESCAKLLALHSVPPHKNWLMPTMWTSPTMSRFSQSYERVDGNSRGRLTSAQSPAKQATGKRRKPPARSPPVVGPAIRETRPGGRREATVCRLRSENCCPQMIAGRQWPSPRLALSAGFVVTSSSSERLSITWTAKPHCESPGTMAGRWFAQLPTSTWTECAAGSRDHDKPSKTMGTTLAAKSKTSTT